MTQLHTIYRFQDDVEGIARIQSVSRDPTSSYGVKMENGLLIGSLEWFDALNTGKLAKTTLWGRITKVYMAGHNDWPEFELEAEGVRTTWPRWASVGQDHWYQVGRRLELTYVLQKFKRPWALTGPTFQQVLEIAVET